MVSKPFNNQQTLVRLWWKHPAVFSASRLLYLSLTSGQGWYTFGVWPWGKHTYIYPSLYLSIYLSIYIEYLYIWNNDEYNILHNISLHLIDSSDIYIYVYIHTYKLSCNHSIRCNSTNVIQDSITVHTQVMHISLYRNSQGFIDHHFSYWDSPWSNTT